MTNQINVKLINRPAYRKQIDNKYLANLFAVNRTVKVP